MFAARALTRGLARQTRSISSSAKACGGADEPAYLHAKHMYDIKSIKNRKLKFGLGIGTMVVAGLAVPFVAAEWNHRQMRG